LQFVNALTLPSVALLVIGGARIGIFHAVAQCVVKEYGDLSLGCGEISIS
jgi:hypothetical protein